MFAAKALAALTGTIITALLASGLIPVDGNLQTILTIASIICTALATYQVRNNDTDVPRVDLGEK